MGENLEGNFVKLLFILVIQSNIHLCFIVTSMTILWNFGREDLVGERGFREDLGGGENLVILNKKMAKFHLGSTV